MVLQWARAYCEVTAWQLCTALYSKAVIASKVCMLLYPKAVPHTAKLWIQLGVTAGDLACGAIHVLNAALVNTQHAYCTGQAKLAPLEAAPGNALCWHNYPLSCD